MRKIGSIIQNFATPLALLMLAGVVVHDHLEGVPVPASTSTVNGKGLGRAFAPITASSLGDAWLAAADSLEQGKTVTEAQGDFQAAWQASRVKAFAAKVSPEFAKVLPEGQEPTNPAQRAEVVKLWRDFAGGLKGGR